MSSKVLSSRQAKRIEIQALVREGLSIRKIAKKVGVDQKTVQLWKNRKSFLDNSKGRPPTKLDPSTKQTIKRKLYRKSDSSVRKTADALNQSKSYIQKGKTISKSTVHNYLKTTEWGRKAFKTPLTSKLSLRNIEDRKKFALTVENGGYLTEGNRGKEMRSHILFTDETTIELYPKTKANEGRFRTENRKDVPPREVPKFPDKVMIAAGFCARGVTDIHFVEKGQTINAKYYREKILPIYFKAMDSPLLFPIKSKITFMQDGAPCHSERTNMSILTCRGCRLWGKGVWPGNSPDLNPIENLWPTLKAAIQKSPKPNDLPGLKRRILKSWKGIKVEVLEKLSESFKSRVEEMSKANGGHTRY